MKKIFLTAFFVVAAFCAQATTSPSWLSSVKIISSIPSSSDWQPKSSQPTLRSTSTVLNESFYDSIPLPFQAINAEFDTLTTANIVSLPHFGTYPVIGYKFTLSEKLPITTLFVSDSIDMFAFQISDTVDMSNVLYTNYDNGTSDSLDAGIYYMVLITNYQVGTFNLNIVADTSNVIVPEFQEIVLPFDSIGMKFDSSKVSFINIGGFGVYPAVGFKFTIDKDTTLAAYFESEDISASAYSISDSIPTSYPSVSEFFSSKDDTLKVGTYYITLITNRQYGDYNLFIHEGKFDSLQFTPVTLPYGVKNASCVSSSSIVEFDGDLVRARGYEFSIAQDTVVIFSDSIYGVSDYDIDLFDSGMSQIKSLEVNDTVSLTAGTYFVVIYTYHGTFTYDFSVKQKGETVIASATEFVVNDFKVYSTYSDIIISGLETNSSVMVAGIDGRMIAQLTASSETETIRVPNTGIYIVYVNGVSKKLIVK